MHEVISDDLMKINIDVYGMSLLLIYKLALPWITLFLALSIFLDISNSLLLRYILIIPHHPTVPNGMDDIQ